MVGFVDIMKFDMVGFVDTESTVMQNFSTVQTRIIIMHSPIWPGTRPGRW